MRDEFRTFSPSLRDFSYLCKKIADMIADELFANMERQMKHISSDYKRYMYSVLPWNNRLTGLVGPRGVGKTTMVLQYIMEHKQEGMHLYVTADSTFFTTHTLVELADEFEKSGGTNLYIDEIHKYPEWSRELKEIYDLHPGLKVFFTGSSVLDILKGEADLSRRALVYTMQGMSFREYLGLFHQIEVPAYSLNQILANEAFIPGVDHPLPLFRDYLSRGYYPFSNEEGFAMRMQQIVMLTVENDIPLYADMKISTARKIKHMLTIIAQLAPYKPSYESLAGEVGVSKNNIADYLLYLEKAGMIGLLRDDTGGMRGLGKMEKIYVDNPNLMMALAEGVPNIGNLRETFFYNQMRVNNDVVSSKQSDFAIGQYTFEVGGRNKGQRQIADLPNGIIAKDDIEFGHANIVPLWAFGLNY